MYFRVTSAHVIAVALCIYTQASTQLTLETLYGAVIVTEPLVIELIEDPWMQRLKYIHQYGMDHYVIKPEPEHNRFNHSIGVWLLLKRYAASIQEQVAGLLHDVSHTAFSHVADFVYKTSINNAYQDDIHEAFVKSTSLAVLLARYNITPESINPKNKQFKALAPELPELSADRLEYNLSDGFFAGLISKSEIQAVLDNLVFDGETWYFTSINYAKKLAQISLYLTEYEWGAPHSCVINTLASQLIQRALTCNLITYYSFHYGIDDDLWDSFVHAHDEAIQEIVYKLRTYNQYFICDQTQYDIVLKSKFRGINPWVKVQDKLVRLTELDAEFYADYKRVQETIDRGWRIKFCQLHPHAIKTSN